MVLRVLFFKDALSVMQQKKADVLCVGLLIQGKQDIRCQLFMLSCAQHFDTHHFKQEQPARHYAV